MVAFPGIQIQGLCFRVGSFDMQGITFTVHIGEYFVLTGPNGAGKSLLIQLICGLYQPHAGTICVKGQTMDNLPPWKRPIGYVPQDGILFPNRTVRGNIAFGLEVRKIPGAQRRKKVERTATLLGIESLLERRIQGLSGGERQKVSLARALAPEPAILLLDEPVSAIDEQTRDELCCELKRIQRSLGVTTMHISHNQTETCLLADRVGTLEQGRLKKIMTLEEE